MTEERLEKEKLNSCDGKESAPVCADEVARLTEEGRLRRLENIRQKEEAERQWMESQRLRVRQLRRDMYTAEALKYFGFSPGERTLTDDWSFWHGFDHAEDVPVCKRSSKKTEARHGSGCGGSREWIASLKKHRSAMNRKIAESKHFSERTQQFRGMKKTEGGCTKAPMKSFSASMHATRAEERWQT